MVRKVGLVLNVDKIMTALLTILLGDTSSKDALKGSKRSKKSSLEIYLAIVQNTIVHLKSVSFNWSEMNWVQMFFFSGCLEHGNNICPDCAFNKQCGNESQSDECNFIKMSEMNKLVQEETFKIKGTAHLDVKRDY